MKDAIKAIQEVLQGSSEWIGGKLSAKQSAMAKKTAVGLVALYLVVGVLSWIGIYGLGWQGRLAADVSSFYPNAAATVNGHWLSFSDYARLESGLAASNQTSGQPAANLDQAALGELVNQYVVDTWATQHGINVTDQQVDAQVEANFKTMGGDKAALQALGAQGIGKSDYSRMVRTYMEAAAINQQLATDSGQLQAAKQSAQTLLTQAKAGTDFGSLVQRYSQAITTDDPKTPGLLSTDHGSLPTAVAAAVNGLSDGQLAGQVVGTNGAFYVAKRVHDDYGLAAQVIVIRPQSYQQWLAGQVSSVKLVKLLPQLR